jgi:hypothetical protein
VLLCAGAYSRKCAEIGFSGVSCYECFETSRLKTLEEYGDERYFRSFLGDQWRYHGRSYIMNTWRGAYERHSRVLGVDLVGDPDKLANNKNLAARAAIWFWEKGNVTGESINRYANQGNVKAVCSIVNRGQVEPQGPINGWDMRVHFHQRALNILPDGFTLDLGSSPSRRRKSCFHKALWTARACKSSRSVSAALWLPIPSTTVATTSYILATAF